MDKRDYNTKPPAGTEAPVCYEFARDEEATPAENEELELVRKIQNATVLRGDMEELERQLGAVLTKYGLDAAKVMGSWKTLGSSYADLEANVYYMQTLVA